MDTKKLTWVKREKRAIYLLQRKYMISEVSQFSLNSPLHCIVKWQWKNSTTEVQIPCHVDHPSHLKSRWMRDYCIHLFTEVLVKILPLLQNISHQKYGVVAFQLSNTHSHSTHKMLLQTWSKCWTQWLLRWLLFLSHWSLLLSVSQSIF
jgi:hypothetical protein